MADAFPPVIDALEVSPSQASMENERVAERRKKDALRKKKKYHSRTAD
jgi:hypothetical protein